MVSSDGSRAYANMENAWRYRKEFVKGCSCKAEEYDPAEIELANQKSQPDGSGQAATVPPGPGGAQFADEAEKPKQPQ